ncbi:MAG: SMP-30/gluconolactonase/LRE family protein [Promethearchaeota archaeon]|jgi:sugar lactone lactonase YvrE
MSNPELLETEILLEGLQFPEGPRWHDGKLWFSDMNARKVMTVNLQGKAETIVEMEDSPSGLGWLPNGTLLIVSMGDERLLRLESDGLKEHANLSSLVTYRCNDMVVDKINF